VRGQVKDGAVATRSLREIALRKSVRVSLSRLLGVVYSGSEFS